MWRHSLIVTVASLVAILSCTPQSTPSSPAPQTTAPTITPATSAPTPSLSPEDVAWAKVVEAAKKEGKVTVYSFGFVGDLGPAMADAFYKKYGIRTDIITGPGAGLSERVRTEQRVKNVVADVGEFSSSFSILLLKEGLLAKLGRELPVLREDVWLAAPNIDDEGHIFYHNFSLFTPWVNTNLVKPEQEPQAWVDLADPKWKGQIIFLDPRTTTTPDQAVYLLTTYKLVDADFFPKLVAQKLIFTVGVGPRPPYVALARGEGAILAFGAEAQGADVAIEGGPIKPLLPQPGVPASGSAIQLIKGTPHPNAGKLFINFVLSQAGHELETRMRGVGRLRQDVPDQSIFKGRTIPKIFKQNIQGIEQINKNFTDQVASRVLGVK